MSQLELYLVIACLLCLVAILTRLWFTTARVLRTQEMLLLTAQQPAPPLAADAPKPGDLVAEPLPDQPTSRTAAEDKLVRYLMEEFRQQGRPIGGEEAKAQAKVMMDQVIW